MQSSVVRKLSVVLSLTGLAWMGSTGRDARAAVAMYYYDSEKTAGLKATIRGNEIRTEFTGIFDPRYDGLGETAEDTARYFKERTSVQFSARGEGIEVVLNIGPTGNEDSQFISLSSYTKVSGKDDLVPTKTLTFNSTVLRLLSQDPAKRSDLLRTVSTVDREWMEKYPIKMDLHTHFGGALRAQSILEIAERNSIPYPKDQLKALKIDSEALNADGTRVFPEVAGGRVLLMRKLMGERNYAKLLKALAISSFKVSTFDELEDNYWFRGPLVKHLPSFGDFLWALANDYKAARVRYVELAISDIVKPEFLVEAHRVLDDIEAATGVHIAFKASLWRHSSPQYNSKMMRAIEEINSPRMIGVDFMGQETNPTATFGDLIVRAAQIKARRPHFQIQVHAGESEFYLNNILDALKLGATQIGHGLNGVETTAFNLAEAIAKGGKDLLVQGNVGSNVALNNARLPLDKLKILREFIQRGIPVTVSTDGHGLYHTSTPDEQFSAIALLDLNEADLIQISKWQDQYISKMLAAFHAEEIEFKKTGLSKISPVEYTALDGKIESSGYEAKKLRLNEEAIAKGIKVLAHFDPKKSPLGEGDTRRPVYLGLPGPASWLRCDGAKNEEIKEFVDRIVADLVPSKTYLVTSGNLCGADAYLYAAAAKTDLTVVALASGETLLGTLDPRSNLFSVVRKTWKQRNTLIVEHIAALNGALVFFDGGKKQPDFLQAAIALRDIGESDFKLLLYSGTSMKLVPYKDTFSNQPESLFKDYSELSRSLGSFLKRTVAQTSPALPAPAARRELPAYCKIPTVYSFILNHYRDRDTGIDSNHLLDVQELLESEGTPQVVKDILRYAEENRSINHPYPDEGVHPTSLMTLIPEFSYMESKKRAGLLYMDPMSVKDYFFAMNDAAVLVHLKRRVEDGMHPDQTLAKVCLALRAFGLESPQKESFKVAVPETKKVLTFEEQLETYYGKVSKFRGFLSPQDVRDVASLSPGQHPDRILILTRGVANYSKMAQDLKTGFLAHGVLAHLVGTDPNRAYFMLNNLELAQSQNRAPREIKWPEERDTAHAWNRGSVIGIGAGSVGLLAKHVPVVIYADQNRERKFLAPYVDKALQEGYKVVVVRPTLAFATLGRAIDEKAAHAFRDEGFDEAVLSVPLDDQRTTRVAQIDEAELNSILALGAPSDGSDPAASILKRVVDLIASKL